MNSFQDITGRWHHVFRQSDIATFHLCPEKLRTAPAKSQGSDATLVGSALHEGIETFLKSEGEASRETCERAAVGMLEREWDGVRQVQMDSLREAHNYLLTCFETFWKNRTHFPMGGEIEQRFDIKNAYVDAQRSISLQGTTDYFHHGHRAIFDWKTNSASYHKDFWRVQRYAVQPTIYCMAMDMMHGFIPSFTFVRFPKSGGDMEMATVERDVADFGAMMHQLLTMAQLIEAQLPAWPTMPTNWWCSPKWCDTFRSGQCMGMYQHEKQYAAPWMDKTDAQHVQLTMKGPNQ